MHLIINEAILPYFYRLVKGGKVKNFALPDYFQDKRYDFLKFIVGIIKKNKINLKNLNGLILISNENSFTQLRLKITVLNIFGEFLNIPIGFLRIDDQDNKDIEKIIKIAIKKLKRKIIFPVYHKEPNITRSLKHKITRSQEQVFL